MNIEKFGYVKGIQNTKNSKIEQKIQNKETHDTFELSTKKDGSNDGKFTFKEAGKNFLKGVFSPLIAIKEHPLIALSTLAVMGVTCSLVPVLSPVLAVGFGALSVVQLGKGCINAVKNFKQGNYDDAEKAFIDIGQGAVGTATSAAGMKQTAKVAAEAKAMNKIGTTLSQEQKMTIADDIANGSYLKAFKENLSLFTTKEGRSAVFSQFKPSNIKARFVDIKKMIKGENIENDVKTNRDVQAKEFKNSPEGIRRANLTDAQIEDEVTTLYNKAFDELDVPKEMRPKLQIKKGELNHGGSYNSSSHTLEFNPESYKNGLFEMDDVIMHEATHCKEAILRASLPQDNVDKIVAENLSNRIINGESEKIVLKGGWFGPETMEPPKMNPAMKKEFASFATDELYTKNSTFRRELLTVQEQRSMFRCASEHANKEKLVAAEEAIKPTLDKLKTILDKNPDFVAQYKNYDEAMDVLVDYSLSHHIRYNSFSNASIPGVRKLNLTPEEMIYAEESLRNNITTMEGNARVQGVFAMFGGKSAFNQYQFSPEEVLAQKNGNKFLIENLTAKLEQMRTNGTLTPDDESFITSIIQKAQATIEYKTKGLEYYEAYTRLLNNPTDEVLGSQVKNLEKELIILKKAMEPIDPNDIARIKTYIDVPTHGTTLPFDIYFLNELSNIE